MNPEVISKTIYASNVTTDLLTRMTMVPYATTVPASVDLMVKTGMGRVKCNWCHVAVPHGWKNKGLLANLNDVGAEANLGPGTEIPLAIGPTGITQPYVNGPYYNGAVNKIVNFAVSGQWLTADCGSSSGQVGLQWMQSSCNNLP